MLVSLTDPGTWRSSSWAADWQTRPTSGLQERKPGGLSSQRRLQFGSREESPRSTNTEPAKVRLAENQGERDRLRTGHVRVTSKRARGGSQREQEQQEPAAVRALQGPNSTSSEQGGITAPPASPQPREFRFFCVLVHTEWLSALPPLPVPPQTPLKWGS